MKKEDSSNGGNSFRVELMGLIFNPKNREILIAKEENNPYLKKTVWRFPGCKANPGKKLEDNLKKCIKEKTGFSVEILGTVFARVPPEKGDMVLIYYLCESIKGKAKPKGSFSELKWVNPDELKNYFTTKFEKELQECINHLK